MDFSVHHDTVRVDPERVLKEIPVHPYPTYPIEARRQGWTGTGLYIMRFNPDGSMNEVVALKSAGKPVLDEECVRTLMQ
jgi:outer membrane biosynthesis protein TonB